MYQIVMRVEYIGTVEGETKEDAKQRCLELLEKMTKEVEPLSKKHFWISVDKLDEPIKDAAKVYTEIAERS